MLKLLLWVLLSLLILSPAPARADDFIDHVTFNAPQPPGSVIIRYGGLRGFFVDEAESQLTNLWVDGMKLTLPYTPIWDEQDPFTTLGNFVNDNRRGGRWWERAWYFSQSPEKGGAPHPRVYDSDRITLNFWLFQMNSKFKLKIKELSFSLHSASRFKGAGPSDFWRLKIRPQLTLGPPYGVRRASISLVLEWHLNRVKMWEFECFLRYKDKEAALGIEITLLKW